MKRAVVMLVVVWASAAACGAREIWVDGASKAPAPDGSRGAAYRTIAGGLKQAKPGDTVVVRAGVYRESVRVPSGSDEKPVTLKAAAGQRVIVSGAVPVTGWKKAEGGLYTAALGFRPKRLLVGFREQPVAREPNEGWWTSEAAKDTALRDAAHLKGLRQDVTGGEAYIWTQHGNTFFTVPIASLDRKRGEIAVVRKSKWMKLTDGDKYYLKNHPSLIDSPGEWAVQADGDRFKITFRPVRPADLAAVQAPKEIRRVVHVYKAKNVRIDGLEVAAAAKTGIELNGSENVTVSRCVAHSNGYTGIGVRDCKRVTVRRCISWRNYCGITLGTTTAATIEANDVGYNGMDGLIVSWKSADVTVRRNYLHHHLLWGHPDNLQLYRGVTNMRFVDNLLLAAGQSIMMEETSRGVLKGNMIVGCGANSVIFGHRNADDYQVHNNTIALAGYGCISFTGKNYDVRENVVMTGHGGCLYGVRGVKGYAADRNLFWNAAGVASKMVLASDKGWHRELEPFQQATGQDANSVYADPRFRNGPVAFGVLDWRRLTDCTRDTWYLRRGHGPVGVGDVVEVNFDGVVRKVTAVEGAKITVSPGLAAKPTKGWLVCNWGSKTDLSLDLRLRKDSPGAKLSATGGPVGSTIDIAAYQRGDFNADGRRDLPDLPPELRPAK